jgi:hypothetical protein
VPDVVADNDATLELFEQWAPELERRELPLALVAQDGLTHEQLRERAPRLAALFIGGSTEWKLSDEAAELARLASELGLFVHWGRVNSKRRIDHIIATGAADSFDGSKWARFRNTYLDDGLVLLDIAAAAKRSALEQPRVSVYHTGGESRQPWCVRDESTARVTRHRSEAGALKRAALIGATR